MIPKERMALLGLDLWAAVADDAQLMLDSSHGILIGMMCRDWVTPTGWTATTANNDTLEATDIVYFGIKDMELIMPLARGYSDQKSRFM